MCSKFERNNSFAKANSVVIITVPKIISQLPIIITTINFNTLSLSPDFETIFSYLHPIKFRLNTTTISSAVKDSRTPYITIL